MPMLGDLLASARRSSGEFLRWLDAADPALAARVVEAASRWGVSGTGFVRTAMADFTRFASEEDWATLTSHLKNTDDPGTACLLGMIHWRLAAEDAAITRQTDAVGEANHEHA
jgi:hypothetical protein